MKILNKKLTLNDFKAYISSFNFAPLNPTKIVLHHTWRPTKDQWQGQKSINGIKSFYEGKGWSNGPHLFIAEDGIWLFTPMNKQGIHAGIGNTKSIGIEIVGDYDNEVWTGKTKENVLGVVKSLMDKLKITPENIMFHRDYSSKSCPGKAITKEWVLSQLSPEIDQAALKIAEANLKIDTDFAWKAVEKASRSLMAVCQIKGVPSKKYIIIESNGN